MKIVKVEDIESKVVSVEGASNATIRKVLTQDDGAPGFTMRVFELGEKGYTPYHAHEWEHEVYIISGMGALIDKDKNEISLSSGSAILVKPNELHQFKNTSNEILKFICLVPNAYA